MSFEQDKGFVITLTHIQRYNEESQNIYANYHSALQDSMTQPFADSLE
jgi:hypothetical protein